MKKNYSGKTTWHGFEFGGRKFYFNACEGWKKKGWAKGSIACDYCSFREVCGNPKKKLNPKIQKEFDKS